MDVTLLKIDNLDLRSDELLFWPRNLFNADGNIISNETYNDGKSFYRYKLNERKFVLNGIIKKRYS